MARVGTLLGDPAIIRDLDRGFRHLWGSAGVVAISEPGAAPPPRPLAGKPVTEDMLDDFPVIAVRHDSNNCSAVVAVYPTSLP
jgi:hypothetical protein